MPALQGKIAIMVAGTTNSAANAILRSYCAFIVYRHEVEIGASALKLLHE
jgi:hypothetical protein